MRLSRRHLLGGAVAALALPALPLRAAPSPSRPLRITILAPRADIGDVVGFREHFEAQRIPVEFDLQEVPQAADVTARLPVIREARPDLVMTVFTPVTLAAAGRYDDPDRSKFLDDIPIVFSSVTDPVASGIVRAADQPGRNVTGTRHIAPIEVQLNTIQAYLDVARISIIYNPAESNMRVVAADLEKGCGAAGIDLIAKPLPMDAAGQPDPTAIPALVAEAAAAGAQLLYIGPDTLVGSRNSKVVAAAALEHKLPTFCATELPIRSSELMMGLVSRAVNVGRFAGFKASEILLGGKPAAAIPVESLNRFSLIIRIEVARKLGLYPPMRLLNIAEIIQS